MESSTTQTDILAHSFSWMPDFTFGLFTQCGRWAECQLSNDQPALRVGVLTLANSFHWVQMEYTGSTEPVKSGTQDPRLNYFLNPYSFQIFNSRLSTLRSTFTHTWSHTDTQHMHICVHIYIYMHRLFKWISFCCFKLIISRVYCVCT